MKLVSSEIRILEEIQTKDTVPPSLPVNHRGIFNIDGLRGIAIAAPCGSAPIDGWWISLMQAIISDVVWVVNTSWIFDRSRILTWCIQVVFCYPDHIHLVQMKQLKRQTTHPIIYVIDVVRPITGLYVYT